MKEWLLVVWIGTSTNFNIVSVHWSLETCEQRRNEIKENYSREFNLICTDNMGEGRSQYPARFGSKGIANK